jgi:hypothetical protein
MRRAKERKSATMLLIVERILIDVERKSTVYETAVGSYRTTLL